MWLSQYMAESDRVRQQYDCRICDLAKRRRKLNPESRLRCFLDEPEIDVEVYKVGRDGHVSRKKITRTFTKESTIDFLCEMGDTIPDLPAFQPFDEGGVMGITGIYNCNSHHGICPMSLCKDSEVDYLIGMQRDCETYHCLPYMPPVFSAQPQRVMNAFRVIYGNREAYKGKKREKEEERMKREAARDKAKQNVKIR